MIDFKSPDFIINPYPFYRELRQADGPQWLPHKQSSSTSSGLWLFGSYKSVVEILKLSGTLFSNETNRVRITESANPMDHTLLTTDPPEHTRLRELARQAFNAKRIKGLESRIEKIATDRIAVMKNSDEVDFVSAFAMPFPVAVLADLLGVPAEDWSIFNHWSTQIVRGYDSILAEEDDLQLQQQALYELMEYFNRLIEDRRQRPCNDLISALIEAKEQRSKLTGEELLGMCTLLLIAGHETTAGLLGTGMYLLLKHPEQLALLQKSPEYLPSAIEEIIRYESPLQRAVFRVTSEACEFGGIQLNEGEQVCAVIGSANRDEQQFDMADAFDITRSPNKHLGFGQGIHVCLGAALARTQGKIAFGLILNHLPKISLVAEEPEWNTTTLTRRLRRLLVSC